MIVYLKISLPADKLSDAHYHIEELYKLTDKPDTGYANIYFNQLSSRRRIPAVQEPEEPRRKNKPQPACDLFER